MTAKKMSELPLPGDFQSYARTYLTHLEERGTKIQQLFKQRLFRRKAMNNHKAIYIYRRPTPCVWQLRGYTGGAQPKVA